MTARVVAPAAAARYGGPVIRRVLQVVRWVLPLAALVVILYVVHGAGIPLTVPGVALVALVLVVLRVVVAMRRRRRRSSRD